jgi:hypothetical protein
MATFAIAIFLLLFGILGLVSTKVPDWVVPLSACIAGLVVAFGAWRKGP